jgi:hypothetical protein
VKVLISASHLFLRQASIHLLYSATRLYPASTFSLLQACEINAEKTNSMIMFRHPNSGQNQNIRIADKSFESVATFKYLGTALTNQNDIHDEIQSRLNSGNACNYAVQNL